MNLIRLQAVTIIKAKLRLKLSGVFPGRHDISWLLNGDAMEYRISSYWNRIHV